MLKQQLVDAYIEVRDQNLLTYTDLTNLTGLSPSQLSNIFLRKGCQVSIEKLEKGLTKLGFGFEVTPYDLEEDTDED